MNNRKYQDFQDRFDGALQRLLGQNAPDMSQLRQDRDSLQKRLKKTDQEMAVLQQELQRSKEELAQADFKLQEMQRIRQKDLADVDAVMSKIKPLIEEHY